MKLLIIEDEKELAENILAYYSGSEVHCETAHTVHEADEKIHGFTYDIVLLDLMLPDGDGLEILKLLKKKNSETGVLIISAKNSLDDRVFGLDLGADDYLTKPFHLSELNARLRAIYRRRKFNGHTEIVFEEIQINSARHEVSVNKKVLDLTGKEYELLMFFISNKNRVVTKQSIAEYLWGDNVDFLDNFSIFFQLSRLGSPKNFL